MDSKQLETLNKVKSGFKTRNHPAKKASDELHSKNHYLTYCSAFKEGAPSAPLGGGGV